MTPARDLIASVPEVKTGFGANVAVKAVLFACELMVKPQSVVLSVRFCLSLVSKIPNETIQDNLDVGSALLREDLSVCFFKHFFDK